VAEFLAGILGAIGLGSAAGGAGAGAAGAGAAGGAGAGLAGATGGAGLGGAMTGLAGMGPELATMGTPAFSAAGAPTATGLNLGGLMGGLKDWMPKPTMDVSRLLEGPKGPPLSTDVAPPPGLAPPGGGGGFAFPSAMGRRSPMPSVTAPRRGIGDPLAVLAAMLERR
jgi:hypothetical protein